MGSWSLGRCCNQRPMALLGSGRAGDDRAAQSSSGTIRLLVAEVAEVEMLCLGNSNQHKISNSGWEIFLRRTGVEESFTLTVAFNNLGDTDILLGHLSVQHHC